MFFYPVVVQFIRHQSLIIQQDSGMWHDMQYIIFIKTMTIHYIPRISHQYEYVWDMLM